MESEDKNEHQGPEVISEIFRKLGYMVEGRFVLQWVMEERCDLQ